MAVSNPTANFGWILPTEGGDSGNWDSILNKLFGEQTDSDPLVFGIDSIVGTISALGLTAVQRDGSVPMTGELDILTERYTAVDSADVDEVTLDLDAANFFHIAPSGNLNIVFSNVPAGPDVVFIQIEFTDGLGHVSWPSSVDWPGASPPTLTAGVDLITGYTRDGGTTWRLAFAMENSS